MTSHRHPPIPPADDDVPVLVVGAGPAGLATALTLARQGVGVLLVERRPGLSSLPRATTISTRSMELMRGWGLEAEVRAGGVEGEWSRLWQCETLVEAASGWGLPTGYPSHEQCAVLSPTAHAVVPQDHLEPVLLRHLAALPVARVALGTELVSLATGPDGARAVLRSGPDGAERTVEARYVVGADGAHSRVRRALGIAMHGPDRIGQAFTALFRAPLWDLLAGHRYGLYAITHPDAVGSFLPAGRDDRWLYAAHGEMDARSPDASTEYLTRRIRLGSGVPGLQPRIERTGAFTFAAQLAERFRSDGAFLAGDAAHRVTPRGGTGLNLALADGHDLGWKLAWTLLGWAGPELLDSYEAERRPVAEHNAERSADPNGSLRLIGRELAWDLGGRIAHLWLPGVAGRVSTLDLLGPGLTLFTGPRPEPWEAAAARLPGRPPVAVRPLDAMTAHGLGVRGDGALLVRPDGVPVRLLAGGGDATDALRAAVAPALEPLPA